MSTRQKKIIEILKEKNNWITGRELSSMLGCSDRTIRNDIDQLNKSYKGIIESSVRYGYRIIQEVLAESDIEVIEIVPQDSEERRKYIIKKLLFDRKELNVYDLQQDLYVSEFTLKNDLKRIEKILEKYDDIRLVKTGSYISLKGNEFNKRVMYKDLLAEETKGNFININKVAQLFSDFDLIKVKDNLEDILKKYCYKVREETFVLLIMHVGVAIQRMKNCYYIDTSRNVSEIRGTVEYIIAQKFFEKINFFINFEINENEIVLFASLLMGRQSSSAYIDNMQYVNDAENLMVQIVDTILDKYDIDFSGDVVFKDGLILHLQNLLERIDKAKMVSNMCLAEIKKSYPLVFEMSVFVGRIIEEYTKHSILEDEIGFLAMHIGAAYDRLNIRYFYHAVLIQPNNNALARVCSDKIKERFGERMVIDSILAYYERPVIENMHPDLILTTIPLSHKLNIPTVFISVFLNSNDEYNIFRVLKGLEKDRHKRAFNDYIKCLIQEDYFFYNLECNTYEEVIHIMCQKMYQGERVDKSFEHATFEREKMAYTSFYYGYAIPHALNCTAIKSTIGVAILKKPIQWGEYEVRLVLLLAMREEDRDLLKVFFEWFGNICDDTVLLSNTLTAKTAEEFVNMVIEG